MKILTVDGLSSETKGRDVIIEAFKGMDLSGVTLVSAGNTDSGKLQEPLLSHTLKLGAVDFSGMPAVYKSCDILVFPSLSEGFPNVLLEAAYYGIPMISSRLEGIDEYFRDGRDILLVDKGDALGLAEKIKLLTGSADMRKELAKNARMRAESIDYPVFVREFVSYVSSAKVLEKNLLKVRA